VVSPALSLLPLLQSSVEPKDSVEDPSSVSSQLLTPSFLLFRTGLCFAIMVEMLGNMMSVMVTATATTTTSQESVPILGRENMMICSDL
jgi:hypothetical protein